MATPDVRPVGDLPDAIGKTAARELAGAGITSLDRVAAHTRRDLLAIHGVGPKAVRILAEALADRGDALQGEEGRPRVPGECARGDEVRGHRVGPSLRRTFVTFGRASSFGRAGYRGFRPPERGTPCM